LHGVIRGARNPACAVPQSRLLLNDDASRPQITV